MYPSARKDVRPACICLVHETKMSPRKCAELVGGADHGVYAMKICVLCLQRQGRGSTDAFSILLLSIITVEYRDATQKISIGGLGHLAIQYAAKMGYTVVAISRGTEKKDYALELGVRRAGSFVCMKRRRGTFYLRRRCIRGCVCNHV